jgi:hypothetical protein
MLFTGAVGLRLSAEDDSGWPQWHQPHIPGMLVGECAPKQTDHVENDNQPVSCVWDRFTAEDDGGWLQWHSRHIPGE